MAITPSSRFPREWAMLFLALILVGGICIPLWQWSANPETSAGYWQRWDRERLSRLLLGPEQMICYVFFVWAGLILLSRHSEMRRQRQAFRLDLLPTEEGARILPEDARPYARKVEQLSQRRGPFILTNMLRLALNKYAISRSAPDVGEVVRTQAEVEQNRLVSSMNTVQYLTWAIPAIGFLGTVRGLAGGMSMAGVHEENLQVFLKGATDQLAIAFDCTFVALFLSVILMYLLHRVQRDEDILIIDCQSYCQEHLLLRLYDPQPEPADSYNS
ncbi:MAG TPA: MotA/TolQ/ExbB proton channel family protein [Gemmataceae bacterium]